MDFVWPYIRSGTREIEISTRSVLKVFPDARLFVLGDDPRLDHVTHISTARRPTAQRDQLDKLYQVLRSDQIDPEFVWMNDDFFLVNPISAADLKTPRAQNLFTSEAIGNWRPQNQWLTMKRDTFRELIKKRLPLYDYGAHIPHWIEKSKLDILFSEYSFKPMLLWEVLYGNRFYDRASTDLSQWRWRWNGARTDFQKIASVKWCNCNVSGWDHNAERAVCEWLGIEGLTMRRAPAIPTRPHSVKKSKVLKLTRGTKCRS